MFTAPASRMSPQILAPPNHLCSKGAPVDLQRLGTIVFLPFSAASQPALFVLSSLSWCGCIVFLSNIKLYSMHSVKILENTEMRRKTIHKLISEIKLL